MTYLNFQSNLPGANEINRVCRLVLITGATKLVPIHLVEWLALASPEQWSYHWLLGHTDTHYCIDYNDHIIIFWRQS